MNAPFESAKSRPTAESSPKPATTGALLALWFFGVILVGATFLGRHLLAFPAPRSTGPLAPSLTALVATDERPFTAIHVLYAECRCSKRIADNLLTTLRPPSVNEHVLLVGDDEPLRSALIAHGFPVTVVQASELESHYGIVSAPILIVANHAREVVYSGGYTDRKQALVARDRELIEAAVLGHALAPLPVFGCPVAERLARESNPLRIF